MGSHSSPDGPDGPLADAAQTALIELSAQRYQQAMVVLREAVPGAGWVYLIGKDLPYTIPSQNVRERLHWQRRHKEQAKVMQMCTACFGVRLPVARPVVCRIVSRRKRRCDIQNLIGGSKSLVDCMVRCGWIWDDCPAFLHLLVSQETVPRDHLGTAVEIYDIDPGLWTPEQARAAEAAPPIQPFVRRRAKNRGSK